jgi:hypothetical protein
MTYKEFKKNYNWIIKTAPDVSALYGIDGDIITETKTTYTKRGGRWIATETTTEKITPEFYLNGVAAVPFFRGLGGFERLTKAYTKYGFIPVESISINPDKTKKVVRTFKF